jgi:F0F1-type ATP synthase assembly protein I
MPWLRLSRNPDITFQVPYIPPSNANKRSSGPGSGGLNTLVQAERLMQIAILLPCATLIGWGGGWWLDHEFHTRWMSIGGLIFGMIAGMVSVIRMALSAGNSPKAKGKD